MLTVASLQLRMRGHSLRSILLNGDLNSSRLLKQERLPVRKRRRGLIAAPGLNCYLPILLNWMGATSYLVQ